MAPIKLALAAAVTFACVGHYPTVYAAAWTAMGITAAIGFLFTFCLGISARP